VNSDKIYVGRSADAIIIGHDIDIKEYALSKEYAFF
jgi:hypothetical protein